MKYTIRFNKTRGQPGRGTIDHVWRIFENNEKEYLVKHVKINVSSYSEKDISGQDWNIACEGILELDRANSTAIINSIKA